MIAFDQLGDFADDRFGLRDLVLVLFDSRTWTLGAAGDQRFVVSHRVVADQSIGHRQDFGGTAIVVFQVDDLGIGPIVLEVQDVSHIGTTPSINRLIVITDHTEIAVPQRQMFGDAVLAAVGVLVFVNQHMIVLGGFLVADRGMLFEQRFGLQQQVVEIHRPVRSAARFGSDGRRRRQSVRGPLPRRRLPAPA